jgi:hypothetical protein
MPISFGTNTEDLARWVYVPGEVINIDPYIHVKVLCISTFIEVNQVTIPSLRRFCYAAMVSIQNGVEAVEEYPDNMQMLSLSYTDMYSLSNVPSKVIRISLTENKRLQYDTLPSKLVSLECYGQHFGDIVVTSTLSKLSLFRCSFDRILGLDQDTLTKLDVFYIIACKCPYPEYVATHGDPVMAFADVSIDIYYNIMQTTNRNIFLSRCVQMAELRDRLLTYVPSSTEKITNGMRTIMIGTNYARRITEFHG